MKRHHFFICVVAAMICQLGSAQAQSVCHGTPYNGSVENAVQFPPGGPNFTRFWMGPLSSSRVYAHSTVVGVVLDGYKAIAEKYPAVKFTYGETGVFGGGEMKPHVTHRNGLSVDLFVPVINAGGEPVAYPVRPDNLYGYGVSFGFNGKSNAENLGIDFPMAAELLYGLEVAAKARGVSIDRVIFNKDLMPRLLSTPRGFWLANHITFVRAVDPKDLHEQHFHIDFAVPCQ